MEHKPDNEILQFALSGIEAAYEAEVKQAEKRRAENIAKTRQWWIASGGSEKDVPESLNGLAIAIGVGSPIGTAFTTPVVKQETASAPRKPRRNRSKANGSGGRTIPKEVIQFFVQDVLTDPDVSIVTQTEIKDRLLREHPDANIPSVRSAIAHALSDLKGDGHLELVEKAWAGSPNKYRKVGNLF